MLVSGKTLEQGQKIEAVAKRARALSASVQAASERCSRVTSVTALAGRIGCGGVRGAKLAQWQNLISRSCTHMKMASYFPPLVVAGCSGAGKGTLIAKLMAWDPEAFGFSVSHTTRAPRPGEEDGVHYHFAEVDTCVEINQ